MPEDLSDEDKQRYTLKAFEIRKACSELSQAECEATRTRARRDATAWSRVLGAYDATNQEVSRVKAEVHRLRDVIASYRGRSLRFLGWGLGTW